MRKGMRKCTEGKYRRDNESRKTSNSHNKWNGEHCYVEPENASSDMK